MFEVYLYDEQGCFLRKIPNVARLHYRARADQLHSEGFNVKVVDQEDGVVVYTLDAAP